MTPQEFKDQMNILCETYDKKITPKTMQAYYESVQAYPFLQIKQAVNKIFMTNQNLPYGTNLLTLLRDTLKELGYSDPEKTINDWISVIKYQELFRGKNWEKKPPKREKITCLKNLPDPLYWEDAVKKFKNENNDD